MKIQIDVRWPRWLQSRRRRFAVTAALTLVLLGVPSALAIHDFTDVPNSSPFHTDISAMKSTGITAGKTCVPPGTPPTYCPGESISREAMAAFMRRGIGRTDMDTTANAPDLPLGGGFVWVEVEEEDVTVGGVAGDQYVKVDGWFTIQTTDNLNAGECELEARLIKDVGTANEVISSSVNDEVPLGDGDQTTHHTWLFAAPSGSHNFSLQARSFNSTCADAGADNTMEVSNATVIVQTFALNDGGTSDPFPPGAELGETSTSSTGANGAKEPS